MYEPTDPADVQVQSIYVLWDKGQLRQEITKAELQKINLEEFAYDNDSNPATPDVTYRRLKAADVGNYDWNDKGFYLPLIKEGGSAEGERVLAAPILDGGVLSFTTFAPTSGTDQCVPGGASYLYRLNLGGGITENGFAGVTGQPSLASVSSPGWSARRAAVRGGGTGGATVETMTADEVRRCTRTRSTS